VKVTSAIDSFGVPCDPCQASGHGVDTLISDLSPAPRQIAEAAEYWVEHHVHGNHQLF